MAKEIAKGYQEWKAFLRAKTPKTRQKAFQLFLDQCALGFVLNLWKNDLLDKGPSLSSGEEYRLTKMALDAALAKVTNLKEALAVYWNVDFSPLAADPKQEDLAEANALDLKSFEKILEFCASEDDIDEVLVGLFENRASMVFYRRYIEKAFARLDEIQKNRSEQA